ncbi:MAG: protein O-mannosyl-transferase family [bacterium]
MFFLSNISSYLLPGDSGELISASYTLGIAHPPGYPLYTLLGNLFSRVFPFSSVAFRYNFLSALFASAMSGLIAVVLMESGITAWLSVVITLLFSTSKAAWFEGTTAEVYGANGLLLTLTLFSFLLAMKGSQSHWLLLAYIGGLSVSHHTTLFVPFILCLFALAIAGRRAVSFSLSIATIMVFLVAISIWLYIPIRASCYPPLMWGETSSFKGFLSHITAQGYHWRLRPITPARFVDFISFFALLLRRFGIVACVLSVMGMVSGLVYHGKFKSEVVISAAIVLFFGIHSALYNIPDIASHIFPSIVPLALLGGIGADRLCRVLANRKPGKLVFAAVLTFLVLLNVLGIHARKDELLATKFASGILESAEKACGENAIILTTGEISSFPVLYLGMVERSGVKVFDLGASNPKILGLASRPRDLEIAIDAAIDLYGIDKVAIAGYVPSTLGKHRIYTCGLVGVLRKHEECINPHEFGLDLVGFEPDDYSSRLLKSSYYIHLARWYEQEKDIGKFEKYLDSAAVILKDDVSTLVNVSGIFLRAGMIQKAYRIGMDAVKSDPDFFEAHDHLGNILMAMGRPELAIEEYRLALRRNPRPEMVYSNLGNAYMAVHNPREALCFLNKALELDSSLVNAWIGRGRALEAIGEIQDAFNSYRHAYRLERSSVAAYHAEFSLLLKAGSYKEALEVLKMGLAESPEDPILLSDLGLWYLRSDILDSSVVYLSSALQRDQGLLSARGNLALALERMGRREDAIEQYKIYIENSPDGDMKQRARQALDALIHGKVPDNRFVK